MRVAALYDLHGNLTALEAVLEEIRQAEVDQVVVGGDVVPGPMARETLECLLDLHIPVQFIQGNGEVAVLVEMTGMKAPPWYRTSQNRLERSCAGRRSSFILKTSGCWRAGRRCSACRFGVSEVLFCHATPRDERDIYPFDRRRTPPASV